MFFFFFLLLPSPSVLFEYPKNLPAFSRLIYLQFLFYFLLPFQIPKKKSLTSFRASLVPKKSFYHLVIFFQFLIPSFFYFRCNSISTSFSSSYFKSKTLRGVHSSTSLSSLSSLFPGTFPNTQLHRKLRFSGRNR